MTDIPALELSQPNEPFMPSCKHPQPPGNVLVAVPEVRRTERDEDGQARIVIDPRHTLCVSCTLKRWPQVKIHYQDHSSSPDKG